MAPDERSRLQLADAAKRAFGDDAEDRQSGEALGHARRPELVGGRHRDAVSAIGETVRRYCLGRSAAVDPYHAGEQSPLGLPVECCAQRIHVLNVSPSLVGCKGVRGCLWWDSWEDEPA